MSKLMLFDFQCPHCDLVFEKLVHPDSKVAPCPSCSLQAARIVSPVRLDWRMGVDSDMPTMADKWERMHRQAAKQAPEE